MIALVTGADGMLGQALRRRLEAGKHDVIGISYGDAADPSRRSVDIGREGEFSKLLSAFKPDYVFHLAAFTKVDDCESDPERAFRVNALGSRNVALAAMRADIPLIAVSTDYVFAGDAKQPYPEDAEAGPRSMYGASKWAGEQAIRAVHPERHAIVRTSWLFGEGGPNFIDTILKRARAGDPLRVVDDQRGAPTWTVDLADALVRLAEGPHYGTFHCTSAGECSWYDLAAHALAKANVETALARTDSASFARPAPRPAYSVLDNSRYRAATKMTMPSWQNAVDRYLASAA